MSEYIKQALDLAAEGAGAASPNPMVGAVVPEMVQRGEGYFLVTASAAGLLNIVETAPYGVTKHAALAFAEWLRIAYGRRGVRVSCLCPQSVQTDMVSGDGGSAGHDGILTPAQVAAEVVNTMRDEKFLVLHDFVRALRGWG